MSAPQQPRLLPDAPRRVLGLVVVLAALEVATSLPAGWRSGADAPLASGAHLLLVFCLYTAQCAVLGWRALRGGHESSLWRRMTLAAVVITGALALNGVLGAVPGTGAAAALPVAWALLLVFPVVYGGLVRWNRYSTSLADPNDVLNGVSGVLAVTAALNLLLEPGEAIAGSPWWLVQPLLGSCAAMFVVAGTALSSAFIGSMGRDPRTWLLLGAFCAQLTAGVLALGDPGRPADWAGTALAVAVTCTCLAATLRPTASTPQPADPAASTIGAFVVIIGSTGILVAGTVTGSVGVATGCAAVAAAGSSIRMLVNVRDLATLAVSRREALTDELTGLANRRAVLRRIEEATAERVPVVLALLDLDKFKEVNDGLGHTAGDDLLRLVAQRLDQHLPAGALLGRLGGDEFAVVLRIDGGRPPEERAAWLGSQLQARFVEPFDVGGLSIHIAASTGLTFDVPDADGVPAATPTQLLRQADTAMYDAKRSGRGVTCYDSARHAESSGHLALVEEMRAGIAAGQFVLHHQPQLDIGTGRPVGVEALVRWEHPTRGLLGPAEFLPLAEVHGLMGALTDTVLTQAVAQAAAWRRQGHRLRVSVNLSASNLLDTGLPQRVAELLATHGVPPSAIALEVTESVLLSDPDRSLAVVAALAALGTTVSIDDFGTGYASLTYLRELPVGELKLDRSFTADLLTDARAAAIVASTIGLAHQLGLRVVAEGVEDDATLADLRLLGCDESQGYLHARPLPAGELTEWLAGHDARAVPALVS